MDCNKEEAIRAMDVAEKRMEKRDFEGAKKTAMKAQQLYPNLPNISQMILVCDVHCASQSKVNGNEINWYGVLQIEPAADEAAIKKQFRKLALSLHPDKNKFAGAADAFKMIGEAQKVLLDREKRLVYDNKCKAAGRYHSSYGHTHHGSRQTTARGHPWFQSTFVSNQQHGQQQPQTQPGVVPGKPTFWTVCPFCSVKYQYYRDVLKRTLNCQNCQKNFTGYEMNPPGGNPQANSNQPVFPQHTGAVKKGSSTTIPQNTFNSSSSKTGRRGSANIKNQKETTRSNTRNSRKRNMSEESSESCNTESSSDFGEDTNIEEHGDSFLRQNFCSDQNLRRSTRQKQHVSYDENLSDDDKAKRSKYSESFSAGVEEGAQIRSEEKSAGTEENNREMKRKKVSSPDVISRNGDNNPEITRENTVVSEDDERSSEPQDFEYPEPDFSDFDKDKKEECFAPGQMWAVYDALGAMPRFYVLIKKVFSSSFRVRITWFEADPDDKDERKWVDEGLPASCGKFSLGHSEVTEQHQMFSHLVQFERSFRRGKFKMYPRRGETWALFKGWDINWHSDPEIKKDYEFEFVEVLSDYDENSGVQVAYLGKLKGFACLFCRIVKNGIGSFPIPSKDVYRFSHKVPSFKMSGDERLDVPQGSFELDPACLPRDLEEIDVLTALNMDPGQIPPNGSSSKSHDGNLKASSAQFVELKGGSKETAAATTLQELFSESGRTDDLVNAELQGEPHRNSFVGEAGKDDLGNANGNVCESFTKETKDSSIPASEAHEIPGPEFYDFDAERSMEKFQVGQIWAVYGDEDSLPKYYGWIKKIDSPPSFALHLSWLAAVPPSKDVIHWNNKKMPVCCGDFKVQKGKTQMFVSTGPLSHQPRIVKDDERNTYGIFPEKGDIWALYKNWRPSMTCSDLEDCDYELVEVLDRNEVEISVLVLELVTGFKSVFKPRFEGQPCVTRKVPRAELLRFSHQIPAFHLTEEKGSSLRGFWELDPAALPMHF